MLFQKKESHGGKDIQVLFQKKNSDIHVLVLGNRGAGKTSLLATTLYNNEMLKSNGVEFTAKEGTDRLLKKSIDGIKKCSTWKTILKSVRGLRARTIFRILSFD